MIDQLDEKLMTQAKTHRMDHDLEEEVQKRVSLAKTYRAYRMAANIEADELREENALLKGVLKNILNLCQDPSTGFYNVYTAQIASDGLKLTTP